MNSFSHFRPPNARKFQTCYLPSLPLLMLSISSEVTEVGTSRGAPLVAAMTKLNGRWSLDVSFRVLVLPTVDFAFLFFFLSPGLWNGNGFSPVANCSRTIWWKLLAADTFRSWSTRWQFSFGQTSVVHAVFFGFLFFLGFLFLFPCTEEAFCRASFANCSVGATKSRKLRPSRPSAEMGSPYHLNYVAPAFFVSYWRVPHCKVLWNKVLLKWSIQRHTRSQKMRNYRLFYAIASHWTLNRPLHCENLLFLLLLHVSNWRHWTDQQMFCTLLLKRLESCLAHVHLVVVCCSFDWLCVIDVTRVILQLTKSRCLPTLLRIPFPFVFLKRSTTLFPRNDDTIADVRRCSFRDLNLGHYLRRCEVFSFFSSPCLRLPWA